MISSIIKTGEAWYVSKIYYVERFAFKKAWNPVEKYILEHIDELVEESGKGFRDHLENITTIRIKMR